MTHTDTPSSPNAALASEASGQRGHSRMRAHSASEDARGRADDTRPEPGSSARVAQPAAIPTLSTAADAPARRALPRRSTGYRVSGEDSIIVRKRNA
jgi:hypothetical protein